MPAIVRRSANNLLAGRWGEELSGYVGFNIILTVMLGLVLLAAVAVGISTPVVLGLTIGAACSAILLIFTSAMRCTFESVVYHSVSEPVAATAYA